MSDVFDLAGPLPTGRLVIEASAGTGKTYSLSALVVRHIAEAGRTPDELLVVTFTRAAAAELRDRTRSTLVEAHAAFDDPTIAHAVGWMQHLITGHADEVALRRQRLGDAIATFDDATITTIHGFCQVALRQLGLRSGATLDSELGDSAAQLVDEVCRDLLIAALVHHPHQLDIGPISTPSKLLTRLTEAVTSLLSNPGAQPVPDLSTAKPKSSDDPARLAAWVQLVLQARDEVAIRRRARQELGYDDLITGLWAAVSDRHSGPAVVESLRSRYALVMVDEFQDTDPVQWKIFDRAFHDRLITVGDPKQAIYRFRGADVQAYLSATDGASTVQLGTNWRSDADLVTATNSLIDGFEFGHERIVGVSVQPAPTARPSALASGQPFVLRRVPRHPSLFTAKGAFSTPLARRLIVRDLVATVVDLLTHHTIEGKHGVVPVQPGDIAVLVPSHSNANTVAGALARAGVPAVRTRTGSVLATPAAAEWAILLTALERPSYAPAARAAGLSVFLQLDAAHLDPLAVEADVTLGTLQQQLATWAELLVKRSFLAWYDHVRAESRLVANLLADPDGERRLTDLDHIAELLAAAIGAAGATAANARRTLDQLRSAAVTIEDAEDQMRRIDSDAQAVQVTTLHGSKGLEYPVVLLPLQWQVPKNQGPLVYNDHEANRVIDIATEQGWSGVDNKEKPASRKYYANTDARGDRLRLLYVALTRAQHRTVMWWAPGRNSSKSAANALLFDRNSTGAPNNTRPALTFGPRGGPQEFDAAIANPSDTDAAERLQVLATSSDGLIDVSECPASVPFARWLPDLHGDVPPQLSVAPTNGRRLADFMWRHWSFTAITKTLLQEWSPYTSSAPVVGGSDESEAADDPTQVPAASSSTNTSTMPLADVVAGAEFGTLVHSVLERIDPASSTLRDNLRDAVRVQTHRDGVKVDVEVLTDGLFAAIDTPLGTIADGLRLADIPASDRLAELDFDMPLASAHPRATAAQIGQVLLATLDPDDPQRAYAQELVDSRFTVDLAGFMHGSIDAVLRIPDTTCGHRYVVVDYKTNRLHQKGAARPLDAYHPSLLPAAMAHSDYPLQALLYSVATHRYLRWRLGASYSPAQHLGGVAYLFVRGMVGTATPTTDGHPHGVFAWRPPAATIEALDRLLSSGVVA